MKNLFVFGLVLASSLPVVPAQAQLLDDFDDGINPLFWVAYSGGFGPEISAVDQRVEITIPAASAGAEIYMAAHTAFCLHGDYDFQIDFEFPEFPYQNGVRVGLGAHGAGVVTQRTSLAPGDFPGYGYPREVYLSDGFGGVQGIIGTSDLVGKLRQARTGSIVRSYYWDNFTDEWQEISAVIASDLDAVPFFSCWSGDGTFQQQDVRVAFDNFRINFGTVCGQHPQGQLTSVEKTIDYFVVDGGVAAEIGQGLQAKVGAALAALDRGNPNDAKVAMNDLKALVRMVEAQAGHQITHAAANAIVARANEVIATLGG